MAHLRHEIQKVSVYIISLATLPNRLIFKATTFLVQPWHFASSRTISSGTTLWCNPSIHFFAGTSHPLLNLKCYWLRRFRYQITAGSFAVRVKTKREPFRDCYWPCQNSSLLLGRLFWRVATPHRCSFFRFATGGATVWSRRWTKSAFASLLILEVWRKQADAC